MGGARAGEVASEIAIETFVAERDTEAAAEQQLEQIAKAANRRIYDTAQSDSRHAGMGTTLTAAMVDGNHSPSATSATRASTSAATVRSSGMTHDHSLVEEFVRQGKLTPEQAEIHPQRSMITRALGPESDVEVDTFTHPGQVRATSTCSAPTA